MKTMKKSMFITTVMMVVLLVVALSTATFAWYTSQTQVKVADTTVYSAQADAASLAFAANTSDVANAATTSITLTMPTQAIKPMVPTAKPEASTTDISAFNFNEAPIDQAKKFTSKGNSVNPAIPTGTTVNGESADWYLVNTSGTAPVTPYVAVNIVTEGWTPLKTQPNDWKAELAKGADGKYVMAENGATITNPEGNVEDLAFEANKYAVKNSAIAEDLRVAIFAGDKYVETWASTAANTYYGAIANEGSVDEMDSYTAKATGSKVPLSQIQALGGLQIQVVAWFDGLGLTNNDSALAAVFNVVFTTAA